MVRANGRPTARSPATHTPPERRSQPTPVTQPADNEASGAWLPSILDPGTAPPPPIESTSYHHIGPARVCGRYVRGEVAAGSGAWSFVRRGGVRNGIIGRWCARASAGLPTRVRRAGAPLARRVLARRRV